MEVETPLLAQATVTDPNLEVFAVSTDVDGHEPLSVPANLTGVCDETFTRGRVGRHFSDQQSLSKRRVGSLIIIRSFHCWSGIELTGTTRMLMREVAELIGEILGRDWLAGMDVSRLVSRAPEP